jgi:SpoVK/Ycf46/Vps4 family AAA+-type ATPase
MDASFLLQTYIINEISDVMSGGATNDTAVGMNRTGTGMTGTGKSASGDNKLFYLLLSSILFPLIKCIFDNITNICNTFHTYIKNTVQSKENRITISSFENVSFTSSTEIPDIMLALCHWIIKRNICNKLRFIDKNRNKNGIDNERWNDNEKTDKNEEISYVLDEVQNLLIEPEKRIYIDYEKKVICNDKNEGFTKWSVNLYLKSKYATSQELMDFNKKCLKEYIDYTSKINCKKTYTFTYQGLNNKEDSVENSFKMNILSDDTTIETSNYETFETYFNKYKYDFINEYEKLHDVQLHRTNGIKRKLGLLLYGPPGVGKSLISSTLANYLGRDSNGNYYTPFNSPVDNIYKKRHIIIIPPGRIKKNSEIEDIYSLTEINKIKFKKSEVIILFDEIDQFGNAVSNRSNATISPMMPLVKVHVDQSNKDTSDTGSVGSTESNKDITSLMTQLTSNVVKSMAQPDDLNLGSLLSQLDGIGNSNSNGLLTIATTNHLHLLDPSLYRDGRLNLYTLENATTIDIVNMIEKRYSKTPFEIKDEDITAYNGSLISSSDMKIITDIDKKYSHSTIIRHMNKYTHYSNLITYLSQC